MKDKLLAYWQALSEREQLLISVAGIFIVSMFIYFALYSPLIGAVESKQRQLSEARSTLAWMQQVEPILTKKKAIETLSSAHLLTVFSAELLKTSFKQLPYHLEQAAANRIQLTFLEVPYVPFMTWLNMMSTRYAFSIQQLQMGRAEKPGVMKLLLVIEVS